MDLLEEADPQTQDEMLNLMGVTVVESIDLNVVYGVKFDSRQAYPRVRWVGCAIHVEDGQSAMDLIRSSDLDHDSEVVIESEMAAKPPACNSGSDAEIQIQSDAASLTSVRVSASADGYLVVADVWYPGWQAFVDGDQVELLRANYLFRAAAVPAGVHEVKFVYQPRSFYVGAVISIAAAIMLIGLIASWIRDRKSGDKLVA